MDKLGGQLGNLVNRVLTLLASSFSGVTPAVPDSALVREQGVYAESALV
jgi:methionyl-tRNA synthetase